MPPVTAEDHVKFLISCIRYSTEGKIDFDGVAKECTIVTKGAASKRYERLLKSHGIKASEVRGKATLNAGDEDGGDSNDEDDGATTTMSNPATPKSAAKTKKPAAPKTPKTPRTAAQGAPVSKKRKVEDMEKDSEAVDAVDEKLTGESNDEVEVTTKSIFGPDEDDHFMEV